MSDDQVSSEGCRAYNSGRLCYRATKSPGCPYVHDNDARKKALEKKRLASEKRKLAASRAKLQEQYNKDLTSKNPNKAKQVSGKFSHVADINSKIEAVINQANTDIQCSTAETLNSDIISNMVAKINDIQLDNVTVTQFETVYQLSWATVIYSKPVAQLAKAHGDLVKVNRKVCKFFLAGFCRKGDRCDFLHGQSARTVAEVLTPKPRPVTESEQVAVGNSEALGTYARTAPKGIVVPKVVSPQVEQPRALVPASDPPANDGFVNFNKNSWDTYSTLSGWAKNNVRLTATTNALIPYIRAGKIPRNVLIPGRDKAPDSVVFHPFGRLPAELRIKIWNYALKDREGAARVMWKWDDYYMGNYYRSRLASMDPPPPFLHVNKEARSIACHHYNLTFGTMQAGPETFFNYKQDGLFLQTASPDQILLMTKLFLERERNLIQILQAPLRDFVHNPEGFVDAICRFRGLKYLWLAVADTREDEHWARDPRMAKRVTRAIEPCWMRRAKRAGQLVPVPKVGINLLDGLKAKYYGIDGITWGGKTPSP
jgi:hypothetical protein